MKEENKDLSRSDQSGNRESLTHATASEEVSAREMRFAYLCAGCGPIDVTAPDGTCPYCGASSEDIRRLLNQKSLIATKRYIHRTDERLTALAASISLVSSGKMGGQVS